AGVQQLDGDLRVRGFVERTVDAPHRAEPDQLLEAVAIGEQRSAMRIQTRVAGIAERRPVDGTKAHIGCLILPVAVAADARAHSLDTKLSASVLGTRIAGRAIAPLSPATRVHVRRRAAERALLPPKQAPGTRRPIRVSPHTGT